MEDTFLDKDGIPFVYSSGRLFRISGDKRVEIEDSASASHILFTADRTTPEEIEALKSRLRHTRSLKE